MRGKKIGGGGEKKPRKIERKAEELSADETGSLAKIEKILTEKGRTGGRGACRLGGGHAVKKGDRETLLNLRQKHHVLTDRYHGSIWGGDEEKD